MDSISFIKIRRNFFNAENLDVHVPVDNEI